MSGRDPFDDDADEELTGDAAGAQQAEDHGAERLQAMALEYEPGSTAPKVVATGSGYVAEQIVKAAQEAGVPIRSDPALANALAALEIGAEIPQELFKSVAETLAWAYRLDRKLAQGAR